MRRRARSTKPFVSAEVTGSFLSVETVGTTVIPPKRVERFDPVVSERRERLVRVLEIALRQIREAGIEVTEHSISCRPSLGVEGTHQLVDGLLGDHTVPDQTSAKRALEKG